MRVRLYTIPLFERLCSLSVCLYIELYRNGYLLMRDRQTLISTKIRIIFKILHHIFLSSYLWFDNLGNLEFLQLYFYFYLFLS